MLCRGWVRCLFLSVFLPVAIAVGVGCAASGPRFRPIEIDPDYEAVVYVYRNSRFLGCAADWTLWINSHRVARVTNGTYYAHVTPGGEVTIAANSPYNEQARVYVKPGEVWYLRWDVIAGPQLEEVDSATGEREIASLALGESLRSPRPPGAEPSPEIR